MTPLLDQAQCERYLAQGYTRVPVAVEVLADLDTPLSTFRKLANQPYSFLFESVQGGEKWGRYSIIGLPATRCIKVFGNEVQHWQSGQLEKRETVQDPLAYIETFQQQFRVPELEGLPPFHGGLVGYFGYDTIGYIEKKLAVRPAEDTLGTPDILLMVCDELVVFDNLRGALTIVVHVDGEQRDYTWATRRLEELIAQLRAAGPAITDAPVGQTLAEADFTSSFPQPEFEQAVAHIKDYVLAGDVMQVVISQRMSVPFAAPPLDVYRALRYLNPSPYMFYLHLDDFHVAGSSPEILTRVQQGKVSVRPIAGTRRRGRTEEEDRAMEADLLNDPKEIAEHLMLIDLGRNDVGRVARKGSVRVTEQMVVERYSHVMHIVSNVEGELEDGYSALDALRATFPAGTLSGAPKIRAMEIIDELEPVKRGIYGGAIGYLGWQGDMDTAIAIRTAVIKDGQLHIQAGAGVVADSVPALEWKETMNKGRAVFKAAAMALNGLKPEREMP